MHLPNIDHLRSLSTVAKAGSISAASTVLNRSQSSISIQIKHLEEQMGLRLLSRHSRGVSLTREGELVVDYADRVLSLLHEMSQISEEVAYAGTVRFGLTEEFTIGRLPQVLRQFAEMQRAIEIQVVVADTKQLESKLEQGSIDLALGATAEMALVPKLRWSTPLIWVANRQLRIDRSKPLPLLLLDADNRTWAWDILKLLDEANVRWREVYSTTTFASIFSAAEAGLGVTYMISDCLRPSLRAIEAREGLPALEPVEYGLFCKEDSAEGVKALLDVLQTALQLRPLSGSH